MYKIKFNKTIFIFIFIILVLILTGIYKCPLNYIIGIPCPMCGITRAIYFALTLNIKKAFFYHMLWPYVIMGLILLALSGLKIIVISGKYKKILIYLFAFLNTFYFIIRHIIGSPIVKIHFTNSLMYKIYQVFM